MDASKELVSGTGSTATWYELGLLRQKLLHGALQAGLQCREEVQMLCTSSIKSHSLHFLTRPPGLGPVTGFDPQTQQGGCVSPKHGVRKPRNFGSAL